MVGGGSVLVGIALWGKQIWNNWRPRKVGIYGGSLVGKTTLDRYMTTPGKWKRYLKMNELSISN